MRNESMTPAFEGVRAVFTAKPSLGNRCVMWGCLNQATDYVRGAIMVFTVCAECKARAERRVRVR